MTVENEAKERLLLIVRRSLITVREKSLPFAEQLLVNTAVEKSPP